MNNIFLIKHELGIAIAVGHVGHLIEAASSVMPAWFPDGFVVGIHKEASVGIGPQKGFGIGHGEEQGPTGLQGAEALLEDKIQLVARELLESSVAKKLVDGVCGEGDAIAEIPEEIAGQILVEGEPIAGLDMAMPQFQVNGHIFI